MIESELAAELGNREHSHWRQFAEVGPGSTAFGTTAWLRPLQVFPG